MKYVIDIPIIASAGEDVDDVDSDVDSCVVLVLSCLSSNIVFESALNAASARDLREAAITNT